MSKRNINLEQVVANYITSADLIHERNAKQNDDLKDSLLKLSKEMIDLKEVSKNSIIENRRNMANIKSYIEDIKNYTKEIKDYIGKESDIIEEIVNDYLYDYFKHDSLFDNIFVLRDTQWKYLQEPTINGVDKGAIYKNKEQITEFDGLYMWSSTDLQLSVDPTIIREPKYSHNSQTKRNTRRLFIDKPCFVIVEAKHVINKKKIQEKIKKYKKFQRYLQNAKDEKLVQTCTREYQNKVKNYSLTEFDQTLYIYFAAEYMEENAITYIIQESKRWIEHEKLYVSYFKKTANGFVLFDILQNYQENKKKYGQTQGNSVTTSKLYFSAGSEKV
jgi:hypothetical protein